MLTESFPSLASLPGWHLLLQLSKAKPKLTAPFWLENKIQIPQIGNQSFAVKISHSFWRYWILYPSCFKLFGPGKRLPLLKTIRIMKELLSICFIHHYLPYKNLIYRHIIVLNIRNDNLIVFYTASKKFHCTVLKQEWKRQRIIIKFWLSNPRPLSKTIASGPGAMA